MSAVCGTRGIVRWRVSCASSAASFVSLLVGALVSGGADPAETAPGTSLHCETVRTSRAFIRAYSASVGRAPASAGPTAGPAPLVTTDGAAAATLTLGADDEGAPRRLTPGMTARRSPARPRVARVAPSGAAKANRVEPRAA